MTDRPRYAIYFVPDADSPLYRFGCAVLGYDCYTGADVAPLDPEIATADWRELTREPRTYGFHATLKAPFRLASTSDEAQLIDAFDSFASATRAVPVIEPAVRSLGSFVAIVPREASVVLDQLAADCVIAFDRFRAPLSAADRSRRAASGLSARHFANLDRWGYPYVFADFRFHMTLTGRIGDDRRKQILAELEGRFRRWCGGHPLAIDRLALLRQDHDRGFHVIRHAALQGRRRIDADAAGLPG